MKIGILFLTVIYCAKKVFILEENAILDVLCDKRKILVYDPSGSDIHMSYLGISHLSVRKSYCQSGSISFLKRTLRHELVDNGRFCHIYRISLMLIGKSEAVKYH